jgi:Ser/Thr protein kinase RdoA (MazF antagonist)
MILLEQLSLRYGYRFEDIQLLRDWIGHVYNVKIGGQRYILKIFRKQYSKAALQSALVMNYLKLNDFPVPAIVPTVNGDSYFLTDEDNQVAILYEYIDGIEPKGKQYLNIIGELSGHMRKIMEQFNGELYHMNEDFYIKRYVSILTQKKFEGTDMFEKHGYNLWNRVKENSLGFCHGDLHKGNMILINNTITFFDFDVCGIAHPLYDIATICDETDYFDLSDRNFANGISKTKENVEIFLQGYNKFYCLNDTEFRAVFDYIAIRHYDIQATIMECKGLGCVDNDFLTDQYRWLMKWEEMCAKLITCT